MADTVAESKVPVSNKDNSIEKAQQRCTRAIRRFLKDAARANAPDEAKLALAQVFDSLGQYFESLNDGRGFISIAGWMDEMYKNTINVNRTGIMVPDPEGKKLFVKKTLSKKGFKKGSARTEKRLRDELLIIPHIGAAEVYYNKFMMKEKAAKIRKKRPALQEGAFGSKKGGLLDG